MAKNIVIFSDGTGQAGGLRPDQSLSNVYKLFRAARVGPDNAVDPADQVAFYDAGLGTEVDGGPIPLRLLQWLRRSISSATGTGISRNIADCYEAILRHYEPGDRIYLLGFSRGAYTARCVGGVLALCGVPTRARGGGTMPRYGRAARSIAEEAVGSVYEHGSGRDDPELNRQRLEKARRFREAYGSADTDGEANVVPYFIGVFDTVAALGSAGFARLLILGVYAALVLGLAVGAATLVKFFFEWHFWASALVVAGLSIGLLLGVWTKANLKVIRDYPHPGDRARWHFVRWRLKFYNTVLNRRVMYARHALAIDENRANFARVPWTVDGGLVRHADGTEWMRQLWFAGNHSDIGGSYPEDESRLSDVALQWMVEELRDLPFPLCIDTRRLHLFPSALGLQHCEIRRLCDRYPRWWPERWRKTWPMQHRAIDPHAILHPSVFERLAADGISIYGVQARYRPESLARHEKANACYLDNPT